MSEALYRNRKFAYHSQALASCGLVDRDLFHKFYAGKELVHSLIVEEPFEGCLFVRDDRRQRRALNRQARTCLSFVGDNVAPEGGMAYIRWGANRNPADALCERIGAELICLRWQSKHPLTVPVRYVIQYIQTVFILLLRRPAMVIGQHTHPFCSLAALTYSKLTGRPFMTDCHNAPFVERIWNLPALNWLNRLVYRGAAVNAVHNEGILRLAKEDLKLPGMFTVLHCVIPPVPKVAPHSLPSPSVLVVCSYYSDEPIKAVLEAAAATPEIHYYMTGNVRRLDPAVRETAPRNVTFTGFLSTEEYDAYLLGADAAMALSSRENLLMAACHEAIGAGKPFIVTDGPVARSYLRRGAVFAENDADAIAAGVRRAVASRAELAEEMRSLRRELDELWWKQWQDVQRRLAR